VLSAIYERADFWYLVFVVFGLIAFFVLVVFLPKGKNFQTKDEVDHES
jgi:hypothetical protein